MTRGRFTALILTILAAGVLAAVFVVPRATRWAEERVRREIETRATVLFGGPVRITRLRIGLLPPRVAAQLVEGRRQGNRGSQLLATAEDVTVRASLLTLLGRSDGPFAVQVARPRVVLHLAEGRGLFAGQDSAAARPLTAVPIPPGSVLDIEDGVVEFDIAGGPSFKLEGVRASAHPRQDAVAEGRLEFVRGTYAGPGGEWRGLGGAADFVAGRKEVRLDPLSLRSEGLSLSGKLAIALGEGVSLEGAVDLGLEMDKLARSFPEGAAPAGHLKASLTGSFRESVTAATGTLEVENFSLWGLSVGTLRSDLVVDDAVHLKGIRAHLLGGEATGGSDIRFVAGRIEADTDLRLDGVDAAQVLEYAGWTGPPIAGTIHYSGRHRIDSTGAGSLRGKGVADAVGSTRSASGGELPFEVTVNLQTDGEVIRLTNGSLRAGSTRASFTGRVARGEGIALKMSGGTGNLSEILPLFAPPRRKPPPRSPPVSRSSWKRSPAILLASWPPRSIPSRRQSPPPSAAAGTTVRRRAGAAPAAPETPLERMLRALGGRWEWNGDLAYGGRGLEFTGELRGTDLTFQGTPLGSLRARVMYREEALIIEEAVLSVDEAETRLAGRIDFRGAGSMSLEGTATRFPLAPVMAIAGLKAPLGGRLNGRVALAGRPAAPTGRATVEITPAVVAGVAFEALRGELIFTPEVVEMRRVVLTQGPGTITIEGRLPYGGADWVPEENGGGPRLEIEGSGLDLSLWAKQGAGGLEGKASFDGAIEGALRAPSGGFNLRIDGLKLRGYPIGEVSGRANLTGEAGSIEVLAPERGITLTARMGFGEGRPLELHAAVPELKLRSADFVEGTAEEIVITLGGEAVARGRLDDLTTLEGRAVLRPFEASVGGVRMTTEAPIEVSLGSGRLRLEPAVLSGPGTRLEVRGEIDPGAAGTFDLAASGRFDLKFLRLFLKNLQATGEGTLVMHAGGPLAAPTYDGRFVIEAQALRHPDLPFPIDDLLGKAAFDDSVLRIERLDFLAGGGPVEGTGEIRFGDLSRSESPFAVRGARLKFRGTDVKSEFPRGFRSVSDFELSFDREDATTSLGGVINLVRGVYVKDFRLDSPLGRPRAGETFRMPPAGAFAGVQLDLAIRADQDVWLRNDFGKIEWEGDLRVRGTTDHPSFAGRVTAVEGGLIRFRKVDYRVLGGSVDFEDPDVIDPIFDLQAETEVGEYEITLHAEGTLDDFRYELASNPPLPEPDIVALLLTGRTLGPIGTETGGVAGETIGSYLTGLTGELAGRYAGRAGFDVISIDPLQFNAQGDPTTRITIGKQVTPDLFVAYSNDVGSSQGSIYQLDYSVRRDFHFTTLRDEDGDIGGDFKFILRGRLPSLPGYGGDPGPLPTVRGLEIQGTPRYEDKKLLRRLRVRAGKPRNRSELNDGIDRLVDFYHRRGYLMAEVDSHETPAPRNTVDLVFHVEAGPRVAIEIEGVRWKGALRQEIEPFWEKGLFAEEIVEQARARIAEIHSDRGYLRVEVVPEILRNDADEMRVRFRVRRGPRAHAVDLRFEGVRRIPEKDLLKVMRSRPNGAFRRGLVQRPVLEEDAEAIRALYRERGYPLVSVDEPRVVLEDDAVRAHVTFAVTEGPHVTFAAPRFEGQAAFGVTLLAREAAVEVGAPYSEAELEAAALRIKRHYDDWGFPDARITWRPLDAGAGSGDLVAAPVFEIREGLHQQVREVRISGNVLTRDRVIRKAVSVEPRKSLSRRELQASETRLYGRGLFRSVSIDPVPVDADDPEKPGLAGDGPEDHDDPLNGIVERDVRVTVRETPPVTQVIGFGFASDERLRGLYEISNRNVFGNGRYIGLQARASRLQQRGTLSFREKGIFGGRYDILASIYGDNEVRPAFEVLTKGSAVQIDRRITRATRTLYRYSLEDVDLSDTTAAFEGTTLRLSGLSASAVHDTRDAPFDPTRGHYLGGEVQYYGNPIGSEADFVKTFAQVYRFKTVFPRVVWAQALRAGAAIPFGQSAEGTPTVCAEGDIVDSGVPPTERFFAGGDTTLRGFERDRVGAECNGDPLGGEGLFILNEEIRFPIYGSIGGVLFYDGGNVFRTLEDYRLRDLRHVVGAGLRFSTPIGPFRLEYGRLLDPEEGEKRGELFFSIGQAF